MAGNKKKGTVTVMSRMASAANYVGSTYPGRLAGNAGKQTLRGLSYTGQYFKNVAANTLIENVPIAGGIGRLLHSNDPNGLLTQTYKVQHEKLDEYAESYNLTKYFTNLTKNAAKHIRTSAEALLAQQPTGDRIIDIASIENLAKAIEVSATNPDQARLINEIEKEIATNIPKTKLIEIESGFKDITKEIGKTDSSKYQTPQQIIEAFKALHKKAEDELAADRKEALEKIDELFTFTPSVPFTSFQKHMQQLLNLAAHDEVAKQQITLQKQHIVKKIEESYQKAQDELNQAFAGKPAGKDSNGKDTPAMHGLLKKAEFAKGTCESDLLVRIGRFEYLEKHHNFKLPDQPFTGTVGGNEPTPDELKKRCLKNISEKQLRKAEFAGKLWGKVEPKSKTSSGTKIKIEETQGEVDKITMEVPGLWFPYHVATPERMQQDFNDIVEQVLAKGKEVPSIDWTINAETEELRNKMVLAAYKASRVKGISPENIKMTVLGSDNKDHVCHNMDALEVLKKLNLGDDSQVKADVDARLKQQQEVETKFKAQNAFKGDLSSIKRIGLVEEDEEITLNTPNRPAG
ncbi:MAG: hypothetical protein Q8R83_11555 [Legionellaceae bacterium]|nr:hypothetical protein [Legionellaceae bacterium]